jgi:hypothetical protein
MLIALALDVVTMYTGVLLDSTNLPNISFFGFGCRRLARSSLWSIATENGALNFYLSSTSISSHVNECAPGSGAWASNPQAAIVSFVPITFGDKVAAEAAAQQSKRKRTSALAFKKSGWIANHSSDPSSRRPVLQSTY